MFHGASSLRLATLKLGVATLVVGLASFTAAVLPATSASAGTSALVRSSPRGALLAALSDPAATSGDYFGCSVAVSGTRP